MKKDKKFITKDEYLLRNFSKIRHKKWELFVITRILHNLNDPNIEYVCQQYINPKNSNNYYLADICFPSLKLYYEINEGQHAKKDHVDSDKIRQREILEATDWIQKNIRVYDKKNPEKNRSIKEVEREVDKFIVYIKNRKKAFEKKYKKEILWNFVDRYNPQIHIKKGHINVKDNVTFLYIRDALELFGYQSANHLQSGWWNIKGTDKAVWFPKLYPNKEWRNAITPDGLTITQERIIDKKKYTTDDTKRIVFAHYKNILGQTVYKFYGMYELDFKKSTGYKQIFNRVAGKLDLNKIRLP
tara:strand:- start:241 stop:1140 length:900 start_codon:yes stop_codon:yes gene_type:complete